MNERAKRASELFSGELYCSQAVFSTFCKDYGVNEELALKITCGLNCGCRNADLCGAVTGAILVIGLKYGDSAAVCNQKTEEYTGALKERIGSILCRELLGCDISTPEGREKAAAENLFKTRCVEIVGSAAQLLDELGY